MPDDPLSISAVKVVHGDVSGLSKEFNDWRAGLSTAQTSAENTSNILVLGDGSTLVKETQAGQPDVSSSGYWEGLNQDLVEAARVFGVVGSIDAHTHFGKPLPPLPSVTHGDGVATEQLYLPASLRGVGDVRTWEENPFVFEFTNHTETWNVPMVHFVAASDAGASAHTVSIVPDVRNVDTSATSPYLGPDVQDPQTAWEFAKLLSNTFSGATFFTSDGGAPVQVLPTKPQLNLRNWSTPFQR